MADERVAKWAPGSAPRVALGFPGQRPLAHAAATTPEPEEDPPRAPECSPCLAEQS
jgi:hypothetical protein